MAGCIGMIIFAIILLLVSPILSFFCGYATGAILERAVGDALINGLNLVFNTTRFSPDMLPIICGALAIIGSFFKSSLSTSKKD